MRILRAFGALMAGAAHAFIVQPKTATFPPLGRLGGIPTNRRGDLEISSFCPAGTKLRASRHSQCDGLFHCQSATKQRNRRKDEVAVVSQQEFCAKALPHHAESWVLANGHVRSTQTGEASEFALDPIWENEFNMVDISRCAVELGKGAKMDQSEQYYVRTALVLTARRLPALKLKGNPKVKITIKHTRGGAAGRGTGPCSDKARSFEIKELKVHDVVIVAMSRSIPWDRTLTSMLSDWDVSATCTGKGCAAANIQLCARLLCTKMPIEQTQHLMAVQAARQSPAVHIIPDEIPVLSPELLSELKKQFAEGSVDPDAEPTLRELLSVAEAAGVVAVDEISSERPGSESVRYADTDFASTVAGGSQWADPEASVMARTIRSHEPFSGLTPGQPYSGPAAIASALAQSSARSYSSIDSHGYTEQQSSM